MSALESAVGEAASSSGPAPRSIVIANAGSGKTWTLANRILRWSIDEVRAGRAPQPARALAVTFTRKAAGEILARVLSHAAQGARAGDDGAKARKEFRAVVGDATQAEYTAALKALAADLHRLSIGTIDGFFHRIATAMPEEVGLPAEWTLAEEHELEELRALAAAEILTDESADALLDLLEQGEPKPSVSSAIESRLGGASVTPLDMYRAVAVKGVEAVDRVFGWAEELEADARLTREGWDALLARCDALVPPRKKDGTPYQDFQRAWTKLQDELRNRDFRKIAKSTLFPRMVEGSTFGRNRIPEEFQELAVQLAPHLRAALVKQLRDQMRAARELLPKADAVLRRLQAERGLFGFADITRGVAAAAGREDSRVSDPTELRAALGVDLRDLAIDEAQDTSVEQFLSLRPLLEDVLGVKAPERAGGFLLVGDPKQSIYGWRGGTPGLIAEIAANYAAQLGPSEPLRKSFRSSPILMDFVNRVFADYESDVLALAKDDAKGALTSDKVDLEGWVARTGLPADCTASAYSRALREWRFERHESAKRSLGGRIAAYAYGTVTGDDRGDPNADDIEVSPYAVAADIAARIAREHPERSVGILIRTNKGIAETIAELKRRGVAASDEGRAMLLDSPAVVGVLAMLRLVDMPDDRISHFLVSRGPMAVVTALPPLESHASTRVAHARAVEFASTMRARIADEGLAGVVRSALDALKGLGLSPIDAGRLARVVAIAEDFADAPPARLLDFIDAVEADTADSSSADRVRVMTVHRSKGLEFDEVICLTLDENWGETPKGWGVYRPTPSEPPRLVAPLFAEEVRAWVPELAVIERDERRRGILDDLSTFYVAVTRARRGLHLVMNHDDKGDYPTAAKLIRRALDRPPARPDALVCADELTPKWLDTVADASEAAKAEPFWESIYAGEEVGERAGAGAGAEPRQREGHHSDAESAQAAGQESAQSPSADAPLVIVTPRRRGRAAPPSSHETNAVWGLDPFTDDDIALRGVLVHECFREVESIEELEDPARLDAIVASARRRAAVEKGEPISDALARGVREMLAKIAADRGIVGSVGHALDVRARPAASGVDRVSVLTELAFAREIDGAVVNGRIDRLVLSDRGGVVVGATIIDFKTGAVDSSHAALEAKIEGYRAQLASYGDAVAEMFSLPREAVRLELLFVDRREVVRLGPTD
ncbi:MAG: AAA family ATPase [Phycisphaera sp.]|nr:AAA family ATPase [Phycisphaera sp.]